VPPFILAQIRFAGSSAEKFHVNKIGLLSYNLNTKLGMGYFWTILQFRIELRSGISSSSNFAMGWIEVSGLNLFMSARSTSIAINNYI